MNNSSCRSFVDSKAFAISAALTFPLAIGAIDYFTIYKLSFSIFYIVPILIVARSFRIKGAVLSALFCTFIWLIVDLLSEKNAYRHPLVPYFNAVTRLGFYLTIGYFFTNWLSETQVSRTDSLTGLFNRRGFYEFAHLEVIRCQRYKHPISIAYLDLDDFKLVNDQLGHLMGDRLLKTIAKTIKKTMRTTDFVARLGGDEFAILMPETTAASAKIPLSRLQGALRILEKNVWPGTCSIGIATFVQAPPSLDEMIKAVDVLMYSGKKEGKNKIVQKTFGHETL